MRRPTAPSPAVAGAVTAVVAVAVTTLTTWVVGLVVAIPVGLALGAAVRRSRDAQVRALAADLRGWRTAREVHRVHAPDDDALDDLAQTLNTAGRTFDRRLAAIADELPWRRQLVEALPTAAVLFDADDYVAAANDAARNLLGIASDGEPTTMLAALGSSQLAAAVRAMRPGGDPVVLDVEVSGRVVAATITSIGEQRLVLVEDRTNARRLENLRRNFVVNASHELKTPVTSIQALVEALAVVRLADPDRAPSLLQRLEEEASRLVRLVHDLLDLRRLEDRGELEAQAVDAVAEAVAAAEEVAERAAQRDVEVTVVGEHEVWVHAELDDLRTILRNLVTNGVQYNRAGGHLTVTVEEEGGAVQVEVHDGGLGIPTVDLDRIFERFYRVDVARSRETGGTGLGLSLVRNSVVRNGGTIDVTSLLGAGSTFTVRLPRAQRPPGRPPPS